MEDLLRHLILPQARRHVPSAPMERTEETALSSHLIPPTGHPVVHPVVHPAVLQYLLSNAALTSNTPVAVPLSASPSISDPGHVAHAIGTSAVATGITKDVAVSDPLNVQIMPTGPKQSNEKTNCICSFWYHFGSCRNDPNSAEYTGSGKVCKYIHHLGPGTEKIKVQKVPWQWHRNACGLERCEQRAGKENSAVRVQHLAAIRGGQDIRPPSEITTAIPTRPQQQAVQAKQATVPQAHGQSGQATATAKSNKQKLNNKRKRVKTQVSQPATPPTPAVVPMRVKLPRKAVREVVKANAKETCFFWYHGACKRGSECSLLHALTSPPSYVQPPPDFMHYVPCGLEWCPGDHKFEHKQQSHQSRQKGQVKKPCRGNGIRGGIGEDVNNNGAVYLKYDDGSSNGSEDWFPAGFPDGQA